MTFRCDPVSSNAPFRAAGAYLYVLALDGPALAWEFLRRNPGYRAEWHRAGPRRRDDAAMRWGLRSRPGP